jgi:hypothetical protein
MRVVGEFLYTPADVTDLVVALSNASCIYLWRPDGKKVAQSAREKVDKRSRRIQGKDSLKFSP